VSADFSCAKPAPSVEDENGDPVVPWVVKDCTAAGVCAYYQYLQGTSMASPHAVGVAAGVGLVIGLLIGRR